MKRDRLGRVVGVHQTLSICNDFDHSEMTARPSSVSRNHFKTQKPEGLFYGAQKLLTISLSKIFTPRPISRWSVSDIRCGRSFR